MKKIQNEPINNLDDLDDIRSGLLADDLSD